MRHRKPRTHNAAQSAARVALTVTAGLVMTAATTSAARAGTPGRIGASHGVAIAVDGAHSHADRAHVNQFDESFTLHTYGPSVAVTANNRATAVSAGCSLDEPCRSVALSYQIVTTAGRNARLINATNISRSVNEHCPACQTFSAAYQFVVATPRQFSLSRQARSELADLEGKVEALKSSRLPVLQIARQAEELAARVKAVLDREASRAPRTSGTDDPLADFTPRVTMHRYVR